MEVIEVDQLEDTNNERLRRAMPHSGLKPKDNDPKEEDDLRWKKTFDGRRPLIDHDLGRKMTFDRVYIILPEKMFTTPHLDIHSTTDPKPEILSAF